MTLYRSVYPFLMEFRKNPEDTIQNALRILKEKEGYATEEPGCCSCQSHHW